MKILSTRKEDMPGTLAKLTGLFVFAYIALRACLLSFTYDEALSFNEYVQHKMGLFGPLTGDLGANHHPLNTFGMKLFSAFFGNEPWSLRLPNVLAGILYLFMACRLCRLLFHGWSMFFFYIILAGQPFILDYFSVARGYGLSLALGMTSLYAMINLLLHGGHRRNIFLFMVSAALGILSNLTFLYFFIAGWIILALWLPQKKEPARNFWHLAAFALFPLFIFLLIRGWVSDLQASGTLYFGAKKDFYLDTIVSIGKALSYDTEGNFSGLYILPELGVGIFLAGFIFLLYRIFRKNFILSPEPHGLIWLMMAGTVAMNILAVKFAGSLYPLDRTAFPIIILWLVLFCCLLAYLPGTWRIIAGGMAAVFSLSGFILAVNTDHVLLHKPDRGIPALMDYVNEHAKEHRDTLLFSSPVASDLFFLHTGNYYRSELDMKAINPLEREPQWETAEYALVMKGFRHGTDTASMKRLHEFLPEGHAVYFRRLKGRGRLLMDSLHGFEETKFDEALGKFVTGDVCRSGKKGGIAWPGFRYCGFFEMKLPDSLTGRPLAVSTEGWFNADPGTRVLLVTEFVDSTGSVSWESLYLQHENHQPGNWLPFQHTRFAPLHFKPGTVCKVYLWNLGKEKVFADDLHFRMVVYPPWTGQDR